MAQPRSTTYTPAAFLAGSHNGEARPGVVKSGVTLAAGTIMALNSSTGLYEAYVHSGSNATGTPVAILAQNVDTSTAGNGANAETANLWFTGTFVVAGLTGTDAYYVAAAVSGGAFWHVRANGELHIA